MLPKIPRGFITNFPGAIPTFIGPRQFISLLSCVVIFLLVATFILDIPQRLQSAWNTPSVNFEQINYPSSRTKVRVLGYVKSASAEKDSNKRFELYNQIFGELLAIYDRDHDPKIRKHAESLAQFIEEQFPEQYQTNSFKILCLDLDCGQPNYSEEVLKINEEIQGTKSIDPLVLEGISKKFDAAAFSVDPNVQWQNYLDVFQTLKSEIARTNDPQIVEVTGKLKEFLKVQYPAIVEQWEKDLPDLLSI